MPKARKKRVMTLAVLDGEEHLLDLETGRQRSQLPAALRALRRIPQGAVSQVRIEQVLVTAGIRVTRDAEGDTLAHLLGDEVNLVVSPDWLYVRFVKLVEIGAFVPDTVKHAVVGHLNTEFNLARFCLLNDTEVYADYAMSYERGISAVQLVQMLKAFTRAVNAAFTSDAAASLLGEQGR